MFKPRPYDPDRPDRRTLAQRAATERNFRVFRLHGLHAQLFLLTGPRRELPQMLVDQELIAMGALTTLNAQRKQIEKKMRKAAKQPPRKCADCGEPIDTCDCIPF